MKPKVFVVMPVHDRLKFTKRCLGDLGRQKYKDLEIIDKAFKENKFSPTPNALCDWCEFQRHCPYFKHKFKEAKIFKRPKILAMVYK